MVRSFSSRAAALTLVAAALVLARPGQARAALSGDCSLTANAASTGPVDVASTNVWHLQSSDSISVAGSSGAVQTSATGYLSVFGFEIPLVGGSSAGETSVSSDLVDGSLLATLGRVFVLSGSSSGGGGGCTASLAVVLDDVNPFLTVLGGLGILGTGLGLLALVRAVRNPGQRVVSGLVGLAAFAAGFSLLLQQTSTPGAVAAAVPRSPWAGTVPSPAAFAIDGAFLAWSVALSLGVVFLLPFPADLFNSTLDRNAGRVRASLGRLPLVGRLIAAPRTGAAAEGSVEVSATAAGSHNPLVIIGFLLVAGALYALLSPDIAPTEDSLLTYVGIVTALAVQTWFTAIPLRAMHRAKTGDPGTMRVVPATLLVAAACVAVSRLIGFQPGYLYGLLMGYAYAKHLSAVDDGGASAAGAAWLLGLGLISWFALGAVRGNGIEPSIARSVAEAVFASLVVGGLEGVAFGMLPLRYLHGEPLYRWSRLRWTLLYLPGLLAFALVVLNPANGFEGHGNAPFVASVAVFVGFAVLSIAFWAWFRYRPLPPGAAEAASPVEAEPAAPA